MGWINVLARKGQADIILQNTTVNIDCGDANIQTNYEEQTALIWPNAQTVEEMSAEVRELRALVSMMEVVEVIAGDAYQACLRKEDIKDSGNRKPN